MAIEMRNLINLIETQQSPDQKYLSILTDLEAMYTRGDFSPSVRQFEVQWLAEVIPSKLPYEMMHEPMYGVADTRPDQQAIYYLAYFLINSTDEMETGLELQKGTGSLNMPHILGELTVNVNDLPWPKANVVKLGIRFKNALESVGYVTRPANFFGNKRIKFGVELPSRVIATRPYMDDILDFISERY